MVIFLIQLLVRVGCVFFSILSSFFFSFLFFFSNRVVRKEVSWVKGVARIFQRGIAN